MANRFEKTTEPLGSHFQQTLNERATERIPEKRYDTTSVGCSLVLTITFTVLPSPIPTESRPVPARNPVKTSRIGKKKERVTCSGVSTMSRVPHDPVPK